MWFQAYWLASIRAICCATLHYLAAAEMNAFHCARNRCETIHFDLYNFDEMVMWRWWHAIHARTTLEAMQLFALPHICSSQRYEHSNITLFLRNTKSKINQIVRLSLRHKLPGILHSFERECAPTKCEGWLHAKCMHFISECRNKPIKINVYDECTATLLWRCGWFQVLRLVRLDFWNILQKKEINLRHDSMEKSENQRFFFQKSVPNDWLIIIDFVRKNQQFISFLMLTFGSNSRFYVE